jgi:hypothetical protein
MVKDYFEQSWLTKEGVESFRKEMREKYHYTNFKSVMHFTFLMLFCAAGIGVPLFFVESWTWTLAYVVVPTFIYANVVEYWVHRIPMHRPVRMMKILFNRHTLEHHHYFTDAHPTFDSVQDFEATLFPLAMIIFLFGIVAGPTCWVVSLLFGSDIALVFYATGVAYYLNYELFHFIYHLEQNHILARIPGMKILRQHHTNHHDPRLMARYNFNITWPIGDWMFGTWYKD